MTVKRAPVIAASLIAAVVVAVLAMALRPTRDVIRHPKKLVAGREGI